MAFTKLTTLQQIGISLIVGILLAVIFLLNNKSDPHAEVRSLIPEVIKVGTMISGDFGDESGAASFRIDGQIPAAMHSFEFRPRVNRPSAKPVRWRSTPTQLYAQKRHQNCSCFACANDPQICEMAADWLKKEGSLFYLSSDPEGTSYILNRGDRQIIIVWNRAL